MGLIEREMEEKGPVRAREVNLKAMRMRDDEGKVMSFSEFEM